MGDFQMPSQRSHKLLRRCVCYMLVDKKFVYKNSDLCTSNEIDQQNGAFQKHLYQHQKIQRNTELFANDAGLSFHNTRMPSVIVYLMCSKIYHIHFAGETRMYPSTCPGMLFL